LGIFRHRIVTFARIGGRQTGGVTRSAPRISPRLVEAVARLDDGKMPVAELCRRVGATADALGLPRPSYEQVRVLARTARRWAAVNPTTAEVLVDVASGVRPPEDVLRHMAGTLPPRARR
jgi:hypothetical protein